MAMFQTYDPPAETGAGAARITKLRGAMRELDIDAFIVPRADAHQGEYVSKSAERLPWLTGFTGSAGFAAIGRTTAALFVDGRYGVQAKAQVDTAVLEILQIPAAKLSDWLTANLAKGGTVGIDPWLHTVAEVERLKEALTAKALVLKPVTHNLVDQIWGKERPTPPAGAVVPHPDHLAGVPAVEKITRIQKSLLADGHDAAILTLPD